MGFASQLIANGLIAGSIYALVSSGFSLIYATNRFVHFAHGASVAVSAYILYTLFVVLGIPFAFAALLTLALAALFGYGMYCGYYRVLQQRKASSVILLLGSIALLILFENLIQLAFGSDIKTISYLEGLQSIRVLGAVITPIQIAIIITALILFVLLFLFMKKTRLGRDMRAIADNRELAGIIGINEQKVAGYSFLIGSLLAGIAGILISLEQNLDPGMGTMLMVKGFTGAVIGGIDIAAGAVLGSYLLGLAENLGIWFIPSGYKDAIAFGLLFLFLLLRPQGILGINKGVKK